MIFNKKLIGGVLALFLLAFLVSIFEVPFWRISQKSKKPLVPTDTLQTLEFLSKEITMDRIYAPDEGPVDWGQFSLLPGEGPELLWIHSVTVTPVTPDGQKKLSSKFLYYGCLDFPNYLSHRQQFGGTVIGTSRLFALSPGQDHVEFPPGFGIPVLSNEFLQWSVIAMNLNLPAESPSVKFKFTVGYFRDEDLSSSPKPLFPAVGWSAKLLYGPDGYMGVEKSNEMIREAESSRGVHALEGSRYLYDDTQGRKFSLYWMLNPGRDVNHTLITRVLNLPFDTTLHYTNAHLYPFAESLELKDLNAGETLLKIGAGDHFESLEGTSVYKDHEYDLIMTHLNPTKETQKAMATIFLYLFDKEFKRPVGR